MVYSRLIPLFCLLVAAACACTVPAWAFDSRSKPSAPTIELNLDVADSLRQRPSEQPVATSAADHLTSTAETYERPVEKQPRLIWTVGPPGQIIDSGKKKKGSTKKKASPTVTEPVPAPVVQPPVAAAPLESPKPVGEIPPPASSPYVPAMQPATERKYFPENPAPPVAEPQKSPAPVIEPAPKPGPKAVKKPAKKKTAPKAKKEKKKEPVVKQESKPLPPPPFEEVEEPATEPAAKPASEPETPKPAAVEPPAPPAPPAAAPAPPKPVAPPAPVAAPEPPVAPQAPQAPALSKDELSKVPPPPEAPAPAAPLIETPQAPAEPALPKLPPLPAAAPTPPPPPEAKKPSVEAPKPPVPPVPEVPAKPVIIEEPPQAAEEIPAQPAPEVKPESAPVEKPATQSTVPDLAIVFKATETTVPLTMKDSLGQLAAKLKADESLRVVLIAYASSVGDQASTARRVSLSRALAVRAALIDAGINNLRINVQAEGDKNPGGEPDRVDMFLHKTGAHK